MTALIIILSIVLFFAFLLTRYAGVILRYSDDFSLTVTYGFLRFRPGKKKKPKVKKEKKKKKHKEEHEPSSPDPEETKRKKREQREAIFTMAGKVKEILPKFFGKMHFRSAKLYVTVATGDAATTALACGGAQAAAAMIFETIDNFAVLERGSTKNVKIEPDFVSDETKCDIDIRFRIRVIFAIVYGLKVIKEFIKIKIKQENKTVRKTT